MQTCKCNALDGVMDLDMLSSINGVSCGIVGDFMQFTILCRACKQNHSLRVPIAELAGESGPALVLYWKWWAGPARGPHHPPPKAPAMCRVIPINDPRAKTMKTAA